MATINKLDLLLILTYPKDGENTLNIDHGNNLLFKQLAFLFYKYVIYYSQGIED